MKVFVIGSTGFIGFPVAQALSRAGHVVYGLCRSEAKGKRLAAEEIIPIIGDASSDSWHYLIPTLDVVIEAVGGNIKVLSGATKLSYIYTSGTWVHGDSRTDVISDTTPITNPVDLVSWRPAVEQLVVHDPVVNGIVIRPTLLIGRSGSLLASFFRAASEGEIVFPGTPGGRFATIHADDLADAYVRAAEKALIIGGQIFSIGNDFTESVDDFLQKLVRISGAKSYKYKEPSNPFEVALGATALLRPYLARSLLGWSPRKPGLVDGLETYYRSYIASL